MPSGVSAPILLGSTATSISLRWSQPTSNGGCPVSSYAIFRDDGANGDFTTNMNPEVIANNPFLFEYTFTLPNTLTSLNVRFKLQATNERGSTMSVDFLSAVIAGLPDTPLTGPQDIVTVTDASQIGLFLPIITNNGGSVIISYNLLMDDGRNGDFFSYAGDDSLISLVRVFTLTNVTKGLTYRFKYRVKNSIGWTGYSPITYILAASVPAIPVTPTIVSTADTQIQVRMYEPLDNGGSIVTKFELYMDGGTGFGLVASVDYDLGAQLIETVSIDKDGNNLVAGNKYYFKVKAYNVKGGSQFSHEIVAAASALPTAPAAPFKVNAQSSLTSIYL